VDEKIKRDLLFLFALQFFRKILFKKYDFLIYKNFYLIDLYKDLILKFCLHKIFLIK